MEDMSNFMMKVFPLAHVKKVLEYNIQCVEQYY